MPWGWRRGGVNIPRVGSRSGPLMPGVGDGEHAQGPRGYGHPEDSGAGTQLWGWHPVEPAPSSPIPSLAYRPTCV